MNITSVGLPKILFIKGVFKKDCITDDIFEKKILENAESINYDDTNIIQTVNLNMDYNNSYTNTNYDKLPSLFETIDKWPKKSNLLCWNCTLKFDSIPVFIPNVIEPYTTKNKIEREREIDQKIMISVKGVFCSFACAVNYIENKNYTIVQRVETYNKLKFLHKLFFNTNIPETISYPTALSMKRYGGDLTTEEFIEQTKDYKRYFDVVS
jgi:hypothetical protein